MKIKGNLKLISRSPEDTLLLGRIIGENLVRGDVIALVGELGSGKTTITQGIARGIGISEKYYITSPTFTLINEYPGETTLYHLDVYRLAGPDDLSDLGYEEYFFGDGVVVIEWAEKIKDIIPGDALNIILSYMEGSEREIEISGASHRMSLIEEKFREGGLL
ncbi:MAG: tRNA (adenosine(37)-N6)-threonylcarbamoyltransferase complex ATPase subunit type 1 TsaE [Thermodesulfobacteriota bacterium]|nr:tRNA (adenosine(37)-N6)-threonylcarbamoyltransferase complex ATPase subunit type 1 TsaE [Thermodesulfobacteriota bacterium]